MPKSLPTARGRKFLQVLEGARTVFLRDGYEGASMDVIARESGVSKATLYSYFPDKRMMFTEVFRSELVREAADAGALIDVDLPVRQILPFIVQIMATHRISDLGLRMFRVSVGEADRFPELAREYYQSGPLLWRQKLLGYLERGVARGELAIGDIGMAADQLIALSATGIHDRALFLGSDTVTPEMVREVVEAAVTLFLSAYRAEGVRPDGARSPAGHDNHP